MGKENSADHSFIAGTSQLLAFPYLCTHDTGKITGYAVPHCRDKEVSLTSGTDNKR